MEVGDVAAAEGAVGEEVGGADGCVSLKGWQHGCGRSERKRLEFLQAREDGGSLHGAEDTGRGRTAS
ncbi:MAG: hypothetical protein C4321_05495 [Chloroflexota bacterium]